MRARNLLVSVAVAVGLLSAVAYAQQRVIVDRAYIVNTSVNTLETIACNGGVTPCVISTTQVMVLGLNPTRHECLLQNVGATDIYCRKSTAVAVTTTAYQFVLKAAGGANKGDGGAYSCNSGPVVWSGQIICIGSAVGGSLAVSGD